MSAITSYLVTGGSGSGKSEFAERLAARCGDPVAYLATGKAEGPEMAWRIRMHQEARPDHWPTIEAQRSLAAALDRGAGGAPVILLEDIGSVVASCLPWIEEDDGEMAAPQAAMETARRAVQEEIDGVFAWCEARQRSLVTVSSEVGLGVLPSSPVGRLYKDLIGEVNQALARRVTRAFLVVAGLPIDLTTSALHIARDLNLD